MTVGDPRRRAAIRYQCRSVIFNSSPCARAKIVDDMASIREPPHFRLSVKCKNPKCKNPLDIQETFP